jgi:hypothetical protein
MTAASRTNRSDLFRLFTGIVAIMGLTGFLGGCSGSSSDTTSAVQQVGVLDIIAVFVAPTDGSTILLQVDKDDDPMSQLAFLVTNGVSPYGYTINIAGPDDFAATSSGILDDDNAEIDLQLGPEEGDYTFSLTVKDVQGNTAVDTVTITFDYERLDD